MLTTDQTKCITNLLNWKVGAIFMEAGTGKTRAAMEIVKSSQCDAVVWVAPLRTLSNLEKEINKWGGVGVDVYYYGIESIGMSDRIFMDVHNLLGKYKSPFLIVDESLKIKNKEAKRTQRLLSLSKEAECKLVLNGTPLSKNLLDLWTQMEFLDHRILNMSYQKFKDTFCDYTVVTKRLGREAITREFINGYENIDYLYSLIRNYVYKCDLKLNISQYYNEIGYKVGDDERNEYEQIKARFLDDEMMEYRNNNIFLEMSQKMQHAYCCAAEKFEKVNELFRKIKQEETIIFCKYIDSRVACEKEYPKSKVLSYQKEALGLNLQSYRYMIFFDKVWDYALRIQATRRIYRTGQPMDCIYYDMTGNVGLEYLIDSNIEKKISMTEYFKKKSIEDIKKEL